MRRMWSKNQLENQSKRAAAEVIESGLVENAKPIYCHPVYITLTGYCDIMFLLFDNNATAYTRETIKSKVHELLDIADAKIMCSGNVVSNGEYYCVNFLFKYSGTYVIYANNDSAIILNENFDSLIDNISTVVADGVNKIN